VFAGLSGFYVVCIRRLGSGLIRCFEVCEGEGIAHVMHTAGTVSHPGRGQVAWALNVSNHVAPVTSQSFVVRPMLGKAFGFGRSPQPDFIRGAYPVIVLGERDRRVSPREQT